MFDIVAAALLGGEAKSSTPFLFTGCTCFGLPVLGWGGAGFSLRGRPLPLFGSLGPSNSLRGLPRLGAHLGSVSASTGELGLLVLLHSQ